MSTQLKGYVPNLSEPRKDRLKMMLYGASGTGKTTCALNFPKPYLIDTEAGTEDDIQYDELIVKNGGMKYKTQDFDDMYDAIFLLATTKHEYKTLIIDPVTIIYQNTVDYFEEKMTDATKKGFSPQYTATNKKFRKFFNLIYKLDMNVILISHAKTQYNVVKIDGKNTMIESGLTYDTYKKTDYMLGLLLETKFINKKRIAIVKKSRLKGFNLEDEFLLSYDEFAKRYNRDTLERETSVIEESSIVTITNETRQLLENVFKKKGYTEIHIESWLKKKGLNKISDLTEKEALIFLDNMKAKEEKDRVENQKLLSE